MTIDNNCHPQAPCFSHPRTPYFSHPRPPYFSHPRAPDFSHPRAGPEDPWIARSSRAMTMTMSRAMTTILRLAKTKTLSPGMTPAYQPAQAGHPRISRCISHFFACSCAHFAAVQHGLSYNANNRAFLAHRVVSSTLRKGGFAPIRKARGIFFGLVSLVTCPPPSSLPTTSRRS